MLTPHDPNTILRDRYRITDIVGRGGMGCVYRAEDVRLPGRVCAVKEIQPDIQATAESRQQLHDQFLQEASILAQLDHPNLPRVSDFFTDDNREYLVMDYVPGHDLKQLIDGAIQDDRLLQPDDVLAWSEQIISALDYLHSQTPPVLHRDIKPANIKLTPDGRIKLVDFGLVKLLSTDDMATITVMQGRGTAIYTPLEQYGGDGEHTDGRSDIYGFGATLYHLLTCKAPLEAKTRFLNPRAMRPPHELNPAVPKRLSEATMWAMSMHPNDRPETIANFSEVLYDRAELPAQAEVPLFDSPTFYALVANKGAIASAIILMLIAILFTVL